MFENFLRLISFARRRISVSEPGHVKRTAFEKVDGLLKLCDSLLKHPFLLVTPPEGIVHGRKVRIQLEGPLVLSYRLVVLACEVVLQSEITVYNVEKWICLLGAFFLSDCIIMT